MRLPEDQRIVVVAAIRKAMDSLETAELVIASLDHAGFEIVPVEVADAAQRALRTAPRRFIDRDLVRSPGNERWNIWREER